MEIVSFKSYRARKILRDHLVLTNGEFQNNSFFLIHSFCQSIFLKRESHPKAFALN